MYFPAAGASLHVNKDCISTGAQTVSPNEVLAALMPFLGQQRVYRDLKEIAAEISPTSDPGAPPPEVINMLYALSKAGLRKKKQLRRIGQIEVASQFRFLARPDVRLLLEAGELDYTHFVQLTEIAARQDHKHGRR